MTDLASQRAVVRPLLDQQSPADAAASYYALYHDPGRTRLFMHYDAEHQPDGFLARAQTGFDLFRPLVILRAPDDDAVIALLRAGLVAGRPYLVTLPREFSEVAMRELRVQQPEILRIYRLDPNRYTPQINVLVTGSKSEDGLPRYEIRQGSRQLAVAGTNWRTSRFAEVYVFVDPVARGRSYGRSVVAALANALLNDGVLPLYVVANSNAASIRLAESVGFVDTFAREFSCAAMLEPGRAPSE